MRILGNASAERLDVSDSFESPAPARNKNRLAEYIALKMTENKIEYEASLYHLKCGLMLYLILSAAKMFVLMFSKSQITPYVCDDMEQLFTWGIVESMISLLSVMLGFFAIRISSDTMYDKFLAVLVINLALKILLASYVLSFSSLYVNLCLRIDKEGAYPVLLADGIIFLYFLYHGVRLRKFLSENKRYAQNSGTPLLQNERVELIDLR